MTQRTSTDVLDYLDQNSVKFVDFRFTDIRGQWHHITYHRTSLNEKVLDRGIMFDGSSLAGWKHIENSDMRLRPDLNTGVLDPFSAHPTLIITCDVVEPNGDFYNRDPRGIAKKAEAYLIETGIATRAYFGPEPEFFIFDDVRFDLSQREAFYHIDSKEGNYNSGTIYQGGNLGHRPQAKGGYMPVSPIDHLADLRSDIILQLEKLGLVPEKHHHEVSPSQHEVGFEFSTLVNTADNLQKCKYAVKNVARTYGRTATFMPKPIAGDNGSGMHVHQSLWKADKPLFPGDVYADLSQEALWYIGGILKHARALNAFTNPTTNSYKRLVPGYEAPVMMAYAACNRSACIRVPATPHHKAKRIETRFPDPAANPYLAFTSMMMAGLDGIQNKIDPGKACEDNLYEEKVARKYHHLSDSLEMALKNLDKDREFLKKGDVFNDDFIDGYIDLKKGEVEELNMRPHPVEYRMYYSV